MTTLAIVSSYSESCGNAAFTKVLHDTIEAHSDLQVEIIELNLKLLQSTNHLVRRAADQHVKELCERLKQFDGVNIQLEAGLYGTLPSDIVKRAKKLLSANPNTTVTLHSPRLISSSSAFRSGLKKLMMLNIRAGLKELASYFLADVHIKINKKIINHAIKKKCRLIVHTLRAKEQIRIFYGYENVDVHPLKIVPEQFKPCNSHLSRLKQELDIAEDDVLIGIFGYISSYKGHTDAIKAMEHLPKHYKLLVFGRQHPQTLNSDGKINQYLESLIQIISKEKPSLANRIFFIGELSDEDFLHMAANVDLAWLPYYENGQDGSGIASICMDLCKRVLCSTSFAFDELFKLIPYHNYLRFDIGNMLELASKTKMITKNATLDHWQEATSPYTIKSQAQVYVKDCV